MDLTERKKRILMALVEEYIETAEPVGSKYLAEEAGLGCSSATIRNELAELVNRGYLVQPHTSAGRVPTSKGYRTYVNELMQRQVVPSERLDGLQQWIETELSSMDNELDNVSRLVSELTHYPALALKPRGRITARRIDMISVDSCTVILVVLLCDNTVRSTLLSLEDPVEESQISTMAAVLSRSFADLEEEQITEDLAAAVRYHCGDNTDLTDLVAAYLKQVLREETLPLAMVSENEQTTDLTDYPGTGKAGWLMHYLQGGGKLLPETEKVIGTDTVRVLIGPENVAEELKDSSVIMTSYDAGDGTRAVIGIVGPTRMDYRVIASKLSLLAERLSNRLGNGNGQTAGSDSRIIIKGDDQNQG